MKLYKPICLLSLLSIESLHATEFKDATVSMKADSEQLFNHNLLKADLAVELANAQAQVNDEMPSNIATAVSESLSNIKDDMRYLNVDSQYDNALAATQGAK